MDKLVGDCKAKYCPNNAEKGCRSNGIPQCLPNTLSFSCTKIGRDNRLRRLPDAISAALYKGTDIDNHPIYGECICAQISHDLPVKENGQNAHGNVNEECRKSGY